MKTILFCISLLFLTSNNVFAQGRLGAKLLDKLNPSSTPDKKEESTDDENIQIKPTQKGYSVESGESKVIVEEADAGSLAPNTFIGSFVMDIQTTVKGKTESSILEYYARKWETCLVPKSMNSNGEETSMIIDHKTKKMTMLMKDKKGQKTGMITKMPKVTIISDKFDEKVEQTIENTTFKKTGERKTIQGFSCEKWIITSEEGVSEAWITDEIEFNIGNALGMFNSSARGAKSGMGGFDKMRGFSLETYYTGKNGETSTMKITQITVGEPNAQAFSTAGYQMTDMSSFGGMFGR